MRVFIVIFGSLLACVHFALCPFDNSPSSLMLPLSKQKTNDNNNNKKNKISRFFSSFWISIFVLLVFYISILDLIFRCLCCIVALPLLVFISRLVCVYIRIGSCINLNHESFQFRHYICIELMLYQLLPFWLMFTTKYNKFRYIVVLQYFFFVSLLFFSLSLCLHVRILFSVRLNHLECIILNNNIKINDSLNIHVL